ncbi:MAG: adenylyltransferase/cytidyltransferase family protein [Chromatiales bacterium]|nr:adenylyltransferase/cytidyltransferase family protein [Chromatiales bacterium]
MTDDPRMIRALTFGMFDLLHYGHLRLLERIARLSDRLIVGLADDELAAANGKGPPFYDFDLRREMLMHTRHVDEVVRHGGPIDGHGRVRLVGEKIRLVRDLRIDLVVMGDDWRGEYDFLNEYCRVVYLTRTPGISTSEIRRRLSESCDRT